MPDETQGHTAEVSATSVTLPPYYATDPSLWFAQAERSFSLKGITRSSTKFDYIAASLSPEMATEVRELLLSPPAENPYEQIKKALIERTSESARARLDRLLESEQLGDRRPTQLLRRMQSLAGGSTAGVGEGCLRQLFLKRLPASVQQALALVPETAPLESLASIADAMMEVKPPDLSIAASSPASQGVNAQLDSLASAVKELTRRLDSLDTRLSRQRSRSRKRTRSCTPAGNVLCFYHSKFGENARKCQSPCSFSAGNARPQH